MKSLYVALALAVALVLVAVSIRGFGEKPGSQDSAEPDATTASVAPALADALRSPEPAAQSTDSAVEEQTELSTQRSVPVAAPRTAPDFEKQYHGFSPEDLTEARRQVQAKLNEKQRAAFAERWKQGLYELVPPKAPGVAAQVGYSDELIHSMRVPKLPVGGVDSGERYVDTLARGEYPEIYDLQAELFWLLRETSPEDDDG